tara:strand:- start:305 stop:769 length:465 start_codon:yes stop_codon:yes gene_type:complete
MRASWLLIAFVASLSSVIGSPAKAFWAEKYPTYDLLNRESYKFEYSTQKKVYDSSGWILGTVDPVNGHVRKLKLIDCKGSKCMYFVRMADRQSGKSVKVQQVHCINQEWRERRFLYVDPLWDSWSKLPSRELFNRVKRPEYNFAAYVAHQKFCR